MKICCLLPSGAEILCALDLADSIIGISDLCAYPPEIMQTKPIVSRSKVDPSAMSSQEVEAALTDLLRRGESPYDLDCQWLAQESPDLILTQDLCHICEIDANEVNAALRQSNGGGTGLPVQPQVVVLQPRTFNDILNSITQVGEVCGVPHRATKLTASLRQRADAVIRKIAAESPHRPAVFSLEGINPLVAGGHWIPDLLQMAGGRIDALAPGANARRLEWREVLTAAPEKLFVDLCSSDVSRHLREIPWLAAQPGWRDIPAVAAGEVYLLDHTYFSSPGPRIADGLEILAQLTHPPAFQPPNPPRRRRKAGPASRRNHHPGKHRQLLPPLPLAAAPFRPSCLRLRKIVAHIANAYYNNPNSATRRFPLDCLPFANAPAGAHRKGRASGCV